MKKYFIDGSYDITTGIATWGFTSEDGKIEKIGTIHVNRNDGSTIAELFAFINLIKYNNNAENITIYFDFIGIINLIKQNIYYNEIKYLFKQIKFENNYINGCGHIFIELIKEKRNKNMAHNVCQKGGNMKQIIDHCSDYIPYYNGNDIIYIYNGKSIFKYLGIDYIMAADTTALTDTNWQPISKHVAVSKSQIKDILKIFDCSVAAMGTYGKKLAVGGNIFEDVVGGIFNGEKYNNFDGGGWIGYDFCEKYNLSKTALTQIFTIKKNGAGFAKGAFQPTPNIKGIWFGPGTIKVGIFNPGDELIINIFRTVGKHKVNESFEVTQWFADPTPWIEYYNKNIYEPIMSKDIMEIFNNDNDGEIHSRAIALLKINKTFIHHPYVRAAIEDAILYNMRKYITSGGRYGYAYPLVADNDIPRCCIAICDNSHTPGSIVVGFRYPIIQKNGCKEWIVIRNNKEKGEWIRINPLDAKEHIQADFDIDTMVIMKDRPGKYIKGYENIVKEFPPTSIDFPIEQLKDKIAAKKDNLVGKATILLAYAVEKNNEKLASYAATIIQHQVDSLKKVITLPDEIDVIRRKLKETKVSAFMPNWWKLRLALKSMKDYRKALEENIEIENSTTGKIVKYIFNTINDIINKIPDVIENSSFVGIFGNGTPMNNDELNIINRFYIEMRKASKIADSNARKDAFKYLAINIDTFARKIGNKCIWYWNRYHQTSNGKGTLAVWLITSIMKDEIGFSISKIRKFNIINNGIIPENESIACIRDFRLTNDKNEWTIYRDQAKFISGLNRIKIIKTVILSKVSIAVYAIPYDDTILDTNNNDRNIHATTLDYGPFKVYSIRYNNILMSGYYKGENIEKYITEKFYKLYPHLANTEIIFSDKLTTYCVRTFEAASKISNMIKIWVDDNNFAEFMNIYNISDEFTKIIINSALHNNNPIDFMKKCNNKLDNMRKKLLKDILCIF